MTTPCLDFGRVQNTGLRFYDDFEAGEQDLLAKAVEEGLFCAVKLHRQCEWL